MEAIFPGSPKGGPRLQIRNSGAALRMVQRLPIKIVINMASKDVVPNYETSATDFNGSGFDSQDLLQLQEKDFTLQAVTRLATGS